MEEFSEVNNKFIFEYNSFFKAYQPNPAQNTPSTDWRLNAKQKGMLLARVSIPKIYMPNTKFLMRISLSELRLTQKKLVLVAQTRPMGKY